MFLFKNKNSAPRIERIDVVKWKKRDCLEFLERINLYMNCSQFFKENDINIDGKQLVNLEQSDLIKLGIGQSPAKSLWEKINLLRLHRMCKPLQRGKERKNDLEERLRKFKRNERLLNEGNEDEKNGNIQHGKGEGKKKGVIQKSKKRYSNGDVYEGEMKYGGLCGKGKYSWKSGNVYEGEWKNSKMNGNGKCIYKSGVVYEGEWKNGIKHGRGKKTYNNGDIYEGEFKDGKSNGKGKYVWHNGPIYEGEYRTGERSENGTKYYEENKIQYTLVNGKKGDQISGIWKVEHGKRRNKKRGTLRKENGQFFNVVIKGDDVIEIKEAIEKDDVSVIKKDIQKPTSKSRIVTEEKEDRLLKFLKRLELERYYSNFTKIGINFGDLEFIEDDEAYSD